MAPRVRKVSAVNGTVCFEQNTPSDKVNEFLMANNIRAIKTETVENAVQVSVPPAETYIVPDDVWVWVKP